MKYLPLDVKQPTINKSFTISGRSTILGVLIDNKIKVTILEKYMTLPQFKPYYTIL